MNDWIDVKDELPPPNIIFLVCILQHKSDGKLWKGIVTAYFDPEEGWITPLTMGERIRVICWRECPDFPDYLKSI